MKIAILGTGALGIAMAKAIYNKSSENSIVMWTKFEEERDLVKETRCNEKLLPGVIIPNDIGITSDLENAINNASVIINCLPFIAVESVANELKPIYNNQYICSTTKGIDMTTFETTTEIFTRVLNSRKVCALSGPSFAVEIANNNPISFMLASKNNETLDFVYELLSSENIFLEKSSDEIGIQICGAVKNAVAIGSGILHGMNAADSTKAAYLARGMKDMVRIITSLGGEEKTVSSYAGIGDLILTCMSETSRNFSCGKLLGQGNNLVQAIEKMGGKTVEGIKIIDSLNNYMKEKDLELDTIPKLYNIVYKSGNIDTIQRI